MLSPNEMYPTLNAFFAPTVPAGEFELVSADEHAVVRSVSTAARTITRLPHAILGLIFSLSVSFLDRSMDWKLFAVSDLRFLQELTSHACVP
jgi:hypothetical protein